MTTEPMNTAEVTPPTREQRILFLSRKFREAAQEHSEAFHEERVLRRLLRAAVERTSDMLETYEQAKSALVAAAAEVDVLSPAMVAEAIEDSKKRGK